VAAHDVTMKLEQTFRRSAKIDADRIQVEIVDGNVTLRGMSNHGVNTMTPREQHSFCLVSPGSKIERMCFRRKALQHVRK